MIKHNQIECPACQWNPNGEKLWACSCQHTWDTFTTRGKCPSCSTQWEDTFCPVCGETSKHNDWYLKRDSRFEYIAKLLNLNIEDAVIQYWNKFYDHNEHELRFDYLNFKSFKVLTPKNVMFVTPKLPVNQDKIHNSNTFNNLKNKGRIDDQMCRSFIAGISTDIVLVSRDYKNRLHKYHYPYYEIDGILPIAINTYRNAYLVLGYTKQEYRGIYLLDERLKYPLFLSLDINELFSDFIFETEAKKTLKYKQFDVDGPQYKIPEIEMGEECVESKIYFDPKVLIMFYTSELKRVFGLECILDYSNEEIEIKLEIDKKKYKLSFSTQNNMGQMRIIDEFNAYLNQLLSMRYGLDMKFAFYRLNNILVCYKVDSIMQALRNGSIEIYDNIYLPRQSYCNTTYPNLNPEYLKDKPIDDWDENTKFIFLSDLSRY